MDPRPAPRHLLAGAVAAALLGSAVAGAASPGSVDGGSRHDVPTPVFRHLTTADGLVHDSVYAVLQDRIGFLWLATEDGLSRWDGIEFRTFRHDPQDPLSLPQGDLNALAEDRRGRLWIGTWGSGVLAFDPRTEHFDRPAGLERLAGERIQTLAERGDTLWIGSYSAGLHRFDTSGDGPLVSYRHRAGDPGSLSHDHVWALSPDPRGGLWVATQDGLDFLAAGADHFRHYGPAEGLPSREVLDVLVDSAGNVWAGTVAGMARLRPDGDRFEEVLQPARELLGPGRDAYREVVEDRRGVLWIATRDRGVLRYEPSTGALTHYQHDRDRTSLASDDVRALFLDRAGNLWLGTRGGGADRIDLKPPKFTLFRADAPTSGLSHGRVWALAEDRDGALWIGTSDGLDRLDRDAPPGERWQHFRREPGNPASLPHNTVRALLVDRRGDLWVGTNGGGLSRLDRATGRFERPLEELREDSVWTLHEDREGVLWVGTGSAGLVRVEPRTGVVERFRHDPADPSSLGHDRVMAIHEDRHGVLWVGTDGGGLHAFDRARGIFHRHRHDRGRPNSLSNDSILALHEGRDGALWVGTHGGLNRLAPSRAGAALDPATGFTLVSEREGLPDNVIYGILEDAAGRLWLPTNRGLARLDPSTGEVRVYGPEDGLQSLGFNEGASHRTADGEMLVGGIQGFNIFRPEQVLDNQHVPAVAITGIRVFNRDREVPGPVWAAPRVELSFRDAFAVRFAALDFTAPQRNRYAYRLVSPGARGAATAWTATDRPLATFSNLEPGEHRLEVRGANNDGVWNAAGTSLVLAIEAPFWRLRSVQAAAALALVLALAGAHQLRTRSIERHNRRLEGLVAQRTAELRERSDRLEAASEETRRFAYLVSHDLRSPLVTIQGFTGELRNSLAEAARLGQPLLAQLPEAERRRVEQIFRREVPEALGFLESSASRLDRMTRAILDLARLGSRQATLERVDLERLVSKVVDDLAHPIATSGAEVEVRPLPPVLADRAALERIFENLIGNAIKYLQPGRPGRVVVSGERVGDEVAIAVRDNGRGIAEDDVPRAFEALRRVGRQDTAGEGMGLAYVRALVRRDGGRIECRSRLGEGSTFTVFLPQAPPLADPAGAPAADPPSGGRRLRPAPPPVPSPR